MQILGIGTTVVDRVVMMDCYPTVDTKKEIQQSWTQVGGPVPVALSTAATLGQKTRLLSRWGNDFDGRHISDTLSDRAIDLTFTKTRDDWQSGMAQVWLSQDNGSRTIAFSRGVFPPLSAADITDELLDGCDILHLDGWASEAATTAAIKIKNLGGTVVLDAGSVKPGLDRLLPYIDVLIASKLFCDAYEAAANGQQTPATAAELNDPATDVHANIQQSMCEDLATATQTLAQQIKAVRPGSPTPLTVIRTHGSHGATLCDKDGVFHIDGHQIDCIDSNGAGDIFSGAILHGMAQEWSMLKTTKFANDVAAKSCQTLGNTISPN